MADDFKERFKQAGLILGDGINQAFGGKQNIYGTYVEQQNKRLEAEQKRLQMEREAQLLATKQQFETMKGIAGAKPTQQYIAGYTASGAPTMIPNTGYDALYEQRKAEKDFYAKKGMFPSTRESLTGMTPIQIRQEMAKRPTGPMGGRYAVAEVPAGTVEDKSYLKRAEARRAFSIGGGPVSTDQIESVSKETGINLKGIIETLKIKPDENGVYNIPAGFASKVAAANKLAMTGAEVSAKKKAEGAGSGSGEFGMVAEATLNMPKLKTLMFPDGTPESFSRGTAFKMNVLGKPVPNSEAGQDAYRWLKGMLSTRKYLESGKAVTDKEAEELANRFMTSVFSNPKAAFKTYNELELFFENQRKLRDPQGTLSEIIGIGGGNHSNAQAPKLNKTQQSLYDRYK